MVCDFSGHEDAFSCYASHQNIVLGEAQSDKTHRIKKSRVIYSHGTDGTEHSYAYVGDLDYKYRVDTESTCIVLDVKARPVVVAKQL